MARGYIFVDTEVGKGQQDGHDRRTDGGHLAEECGTRDGRALALWRLPMDSAAVPALIDRYCPGCGSQRISKDVKMPRDGVGASKTLAHGVARKERDRWRR